MGCQSQCDLQEHKPVWAHVTACGHVTVRLCVTLCVCLPVCHYMRPRDTEAAVHHVTESVSGWLHM